MCATVRCYARRRRSASGSSGRPGSRVLPGRGMTSEFLNPTSRCTVPRGPNVLARVRSSHRARCTSARVTPAMRRPIESSAALRTWACALHSTAAMSPGPRSVAGSVNAWRAIRRAVTPLQVSEAGVVHGGALQDHRAVAEPGHRRAALGDVEHLLRSALLGPGPPGDFVIDLLPAVSVPGGQVPGPRRSEQVRAHGSLWEPYRERSREGPSRGSHVQRGDAQASGRQELRHRRDPEPGRRVARRHATSPGTRGSVSRSSTSRTPTTPWRSAAPPSWSRIRATPTSLPELRTWSAAGWPTPQPRGGSHDREYRLPWLRCPRRVWVRYGGRNRGWLGREGEGSRCRGTGELAEDRPGDRRADRREPGLRPARVAGAAARDGRLWRAGLPGDRSTAFGGGHADHARPPDGPLRRTPAHARPAAGRRPRGRPRRRAVTPQGANA